MTRTKNKFIAYLLGVCFIVSLLVSLTALCKSVEAEPEGDSTTATLYQLAPEDRSLMESYVIKTENGKLIVIDGGIDGDGHMRDPYLPAALRAISGVGEGEYFEVEAWFLSHAHKDHFYELAKMLNGYTSESNYSINHFYFDFPDFKSDSYPSNTNDSEQLEYLKTGLSNYATINNIAVGANSTYYDDINGSFINESAINDGLELEIDGVHIEFLQTWTVSDASDINNNSLVMRMWVGGQSILFLQDLGTAGGNRLLSTYGSALKSDIVQMAHHGQAGVRQPVYEAIDAEVHLWCTPIWVWNDPGTYEIATNREWVNGGVDFQEANQYNIVACLYKEYPARSTSVSSWAEVVDGMSVSLPYVIDYKNFSEIENGWRLSAESSGSASTDSYGWVYENEGAFRLISDRTVWVDKFGVSFRADAQESEGLRLIISSEKDAWWEQALQSIHLDFIPVRENGEIVSTDVSLYAGETKLGQYNTVMFNWTADRSYSTNNVYLGKRGSEWIININDGIIETGADSALDSALAGFSDQCGYYQFENLGGSAKITYIGIQYGLPADTVDSPYADFSQGPVLSAPRWTLAGENEIAAWTADYGASYTIKGTQKLPLNGFGLNMRIAHGESAGAVFIALTSLYGGTNWYAGTYSVVFRIMWDPSYEDDVAVVQLLIYHPDTESMGEEPIKISANVSNFGWFTGTEIKIDRTRGSWNITLNGKAIFENKTSTDGKTAEDYLNFVSDYFEDGSGYLQVWEPAGANGAVTNSGYVITSLRSGATNSAPKLDATTLSSIVGKDYVVGETISIDLSDLFKDSDGDELSFFATKGIVSGNIWTYEPGVSELLFVTFTASDGTASVSKRVALTVGTSGGTESVSPSSGGLSGGAIAGIVVAACAVVAAAGVSVYVVYKKRRAVNKEGIDDEK